MDKRYDLAEMLRSVENKSACKTDFNTGSMAKDCINTDYCMQTPQKTEGVLTMAFVNMQPLESVYQTDMAFCNGTLFPNLDKPFYGGMKR